MDRRNFLVEALLTVTGGALVNRTISLEHLLLEKDDSSSGIWADLNRADFIDWKFYECGGQILWPVYGHSGSLTSTCMCWLVNRKEGTTLPLRFTMMEVEETGADPKAAERLVCFKIRKAAERGPIKCKFDGDELPMPPHES